MKKSLFLKFIAAYIIFGVLGFSVVAILSSRLTYRYLVQERANSLYSEATLIATTYSETKDTSLSEAVVTEQMNAVSTFLDADIWIVDRNGVILSDAGKEGYKGQQIEAFDTTRTGTRYEVGTYHDMFQSEVLTVMAPVTRDYVTNGYVIIHNSIDNILSSQYEILNIVYITALIIFILSLFILVVFYIIVYRPLNKITVGATKYAAGDYSYKIETKSRDEMGYLAETLNFMSDEISKADDYQRQFIANVSHDFRSPLTSIKGYLEAILDGTVPKELEEKYLKRLISETERLTKLTQSMLNLGTLDKKGFLSRTNFDINRVIRDVCASFEMTCQQKEIVFELTFAEKKEMVYGDYPKIQQVLYNLIDNALKFSNPKSSIKITTGSRASKVFISVKDTGIGIPKKDVQKIWDRFYKADQSRGKDKHGTGLGLSIVKSIINAHGENIDCISTEGVGTEFVFTLPVAYYPEQE
ncbi:MAG: HAMP domain-containing histidine kinase [Oribacterium sp.]|nr:HAMP domain-containing histidine kinase [Oribacterium sp.]